MSFELEAIKLDIGKLTKQNECKTYIRQHQRKWSIKPSLAEKMVDILDFVADRSTTEGDAHGGNKNRIYSYRNLWNDKIF